MIARMTKDEGRARSALILARVEQAKVVRDQPDYAPAVCVLGLIDALGCKEEALREGQASGRASDRGKDATNGTRVIMYLAMTAAWVGDKNSPANNLLLRCVIRTRLATANQGG